MNKVIQLTEWSLYAAQINSGLFQYPCSQQACQD